MYVQYKKVEIQNYMTQQKRITNRQQAPIAEKTNEVFSYIGKLRSQTEMKSGDWKLCF